MNLSSLAPTLRKYPLRALVCEAAWRTLRAGRTAAFRFRKPVGNCPVRFHPIGYYQLQSETVSNRDAIVAYAEAVLRGEFPLLGYGSPRLGTPPHWQRDWVSGKDWPLAPSHQLKTVRNDGSDVKAPWELSRLQWAPVVAKAFVLTREQKYRETLKELLTDWVVRNPVGIGVNWTIAMEAALRGISLCLTLELLWPFETEETPWLDHMTSSLWQHLRFIEAHNEFSFLVRSNHYLSNLVGLATLSAYLEGPLTQQRQHTTARAVQREVLAQTYADGGDREASTGYHVFVAQLALHSLVVQQRRGSAVAPEFTARLQQMFEWIAAIADDQWQLPHLGDCDNGRVELLAADIAQAALPPGNRHSLRVSGLAGVASHVLNTPLGGDAQDAVWFGGTAVVERHIRAGNTLLRQSGIAVLRADEATVVFCAMPNGLAGKGSHTHCDKLSIVFRLGADEVFCDTGSRCYSRSAVQRNADRSTSAHTTLTIDHADQNVIRPDPLSLFRCGNEASVSEIVVNEKGAHASHGGYARLGAMHTRTVELGEHSLLLVDDVSGMGEHSLNLRFILGPTWNVSPETMSGERIQCTLSGPRDLTLACEATSKLTLKVGPGEISREYGASLPATCISIQTAAQLPAQIRTVVKWD